MASKRADLWDRFADEVLPYLGLPELADRLECLCPGFTPSEIDSWVAQFNRANLSPVVATEEPGSDWTDAEADGIWYDRMKALAFACIDEIEASGR